MIKCGNTVWTDHFGVGWYGMKGFFEWTSWELGLKAAWIDLGFLVFWWRFDRD